MEDVVGKIVSAAKQGELTKADRLVDDLSFAALGEVEGRVEFLFGVAVLFGAGQVTGEGRTMFDEQGLPDLPQKALDSMLFGFRMQQIEVIKREVVELLALIEADRKEQGKVVKGEIVIKQTEIVDIARQLNEVVLGRGKQLIDVGANLSTSRLVSFGFLSEADERGMETYQVTEVLDGRTCPICRRMHGKTFNVDRPLARIEQQLTTSDPMEMKSAWPFPKATKAGLRELEELSQADLQGRGWDTPPFHPSCRGVLQRTGTVSSLPVAERTLADPVSGIARVVPEVPGLGVVPVAEAEDLFGIRAAQAKLDKLPEDIMEKVSLRRLGKDIEGMNPSGTFEFGGEKFFVKETIFGEEAMGNDAVPVVKRREFIVSSWEDLHQHVH